MVLKILASIVLVVGLACSSGCGATPEDEKPIVQTKPEAEVVVKPAADPKNKDPARGPGGHGPGSRPERAR